MIAIELTLPHADIDRCNIAYIRHVSPGAPTPMWSTQSCGLGTPLDPHNAGREQ